ncbi:MAG: hypothetical protein COA70_12630 [Planctomycetota bacterium]|nr:MAG: hypothetical protein COA70_12630 [Planctomycetota bacterium]
MDCQRTQELLNPLIDGELQLDLSRSVLAHFEICAECRTHADQLSSLGRVVRAVGGGAPIGLGARILSEARAENRAPRGLIHSIATAWPRAAAVLVGAASVAFFLRVMPYEVPSSATIQRPGFQQVLHEFQADLELSGSFRGDFRNLASRPEGRLLYDLTGGQ